MEQTIFCENLKKFRSAKNLTQEQVADYLNVNTQTVSRWECGTTLPDVLTLPTLAKLYGVTTDDFYKKNSIAYDNYAQRLTAVYEKTRKPEDFMQCLFEYKKLISESTLSIEDQWNYALIHQWMLEYCKTESIKWYNTILKNDPNSEQHIFYRACACRISLLFTLGKGEEAIHQQLARVKTDPDNPRETDLLIISYIYADKLKEAYESFLKAVKKFPNDWELYLHGGEICEKLKNYNEAIQYYNKAGEIGTFFYDELYCKANLYEKIGDYEKATHLYLEIAEKLRKKGFDVEADMAEEHAEKTARAGK